MNPTFSPEQLARLSPMIVQKRKALATHRARVRAEQGIDIGPPWTITWPDGGETTVGTEVCAADA